MKFIYKTVMLNEFAHSAAGQEYLARGLSLDIHQKAGKMVEALLNHYGKDGWEYWRNETFAPGFFQSVSSMLFNIAPEAPPIPVFIFRQELTEENLKRIAEEKLKEEKIAKETGIQINGDGTWTCPKSGHKNSMPIGKCNYCAFDGSL